MESVNRRLEAADSKRFTAENLGVPDATLRKRLKTDNTNFCRSLQGYFFIWLRKRNDYKTDLDARCYGLKELDFEYANGTVAITELTKKGSALKRMRHQLLHRTGLTIFPLRCSLGRTLGFDEVPRNQIS
jgi:hypothetical protein